MTGSYYVIESWETPASNYPRAALKEWAISSRDAGEGIYPMQNPGSFYYCPQPITVTVLTEGDLVWFTDEPRQLFALAEIGLFRAYGRVLVGGLGLGLIHSFLRNNPRVTDVLTIERGEALKELVWPYMSYGDLAIGDFYAEVPKLANRGQKIDTIITDFIFGHQNPGTWQQLQEQRQFCQKYYSQALFLEHGYQRELDRERVALAVPGAMDQFYDKVVIVR